jgi:Protein of unknown function (DUF2510)
MTYVKVPPEIRVLRAIPRNLMPAGVFAVLSGGLAAVSFFKDPDLSGLGRIGYLPGDVSDLKVAIMFAIIATVGGGVLSLLGRGLGAPIAAGGAALFMAIASALIGFEVNVNGVFDGVDAKLYLAAGIVGAVAVILGLSGLVGRASKGIGAIVAVLAFVPPVCNAILVHLDDTRPASAVGIVIGDLLIATVIAVGALTGAYGMFASLVAAGVQLPTWVFRFSDIDDREWAALVGLIALIAIIIIGLALMAVAADKAAAVPVPRETVVVQQDQWPADQVAVAAVIAPVVAPATATPARTGPVVPALAPPAAPVAPQEISARWARDPFGRYQVRYWNGKRWTDHVSTNGVTAIDPIETDVVELPDSVKPA